FNPNTKIKYTIPSESFVQLKVYDVLGNEVATLVNEEKPAGNYVINFSAEKNPSGIYFYTLAAGEFNQTKKMILMK
ncbi:MAG: T9SS type A sorting domain-containing protein, partial [Ignavibacteriaceae bacterium]|nr:T9SS type A sorting domain-containing protein [Ignavibacteriaceae bacterium]